MDGVFILGTPVLKYHFLPCARVCKYQGFFYLQNVPPALIMKICVEAVLATSGKEAQLAIVSG